MPETGKIRSRLAGQRIPVARPRGFMLAGARVIHIAADQAAAAARRIDFFRRASAAHDGERRVGFHQASLRVVRIAECLSSHARLCAEPAVAIDRSPSRLPFCIPNRIVQISRFEYRHPCAETPRMRTMVD
jgi:hypothetical protein